MKVDKMSCLNFLMTAGVILGFASTANAALVYDVFIRTSAGDGMSNVIQVSPGMTFQGAEIIFRETVTDGSTPNFGNSDLGSVGLLVTSSGSGGFSNLTGTTSLPIADEAAEATGDRIQRASLSFLGGVAATEVNTNVFEGVIGTIDLAGPVNPGESITFSLSDSQPAASNNNWGTFAQGEVPDDSAIQFQSLTLTTTAVPEPSSLAMLGAGFVATMYRRRRKAKPQVAA
jgi:hypothetical protein